MTLILVGQSELWDKLQLQAYAAIKQRLIYSVSFHIWTVLR
ncbi:MAG: hypothetical protein PHC92_05365 [Syntrophomonadaceae bacterium]|nr:hypothetical protein [Syntrophomonadaceae bacterium]